MDGIMGGGTPGGSSAGLFLPPNQGAFAQGFQDLLLPMAQQAQGNLGAIGQPPAQQAWPGVQAAVSNTINNPYQGLALQGAGDAQSIYQNQLIPGTFNFANQMAGLSGFDASLAQNPAYAQAGQMGQGFASQLAGMGQQISNQAFDPQSQLFNRTQNQLLDQSNATNSMYGLGSSPYGASTTANAMGNFDLNWQNNLLSRMTQGGQMASGLDEAALQSILHPANAQMTAALQGTNAAQLAGSAGLSSLSGLASSAPGFMSGPYNTQNTFQGNNMGALQNLIALGNQQYTLPQNVLQDIGSYLHLGQSASGLANTIGSTNFNEGSQMFQGVGNLLGGPLGFGGGGGGGGGGFLGNALGLGGGGGMFGAPMFDAATMGSIADVAAGGMGAADVGGGGSLLAAAAPLAFSA